MLVVGLTVACSAALGANREPPASVPCRTLRLEAAGWSPKPQKTPNSALPIAGVGHVAIHVVGELEWRDGVEAGRMEGGNSGLRETRERIPEHADMPGRPRLASGPFDHRRSVRVLLGTAEVELPPRAACPARADAEDGITGREERRGIRAAVTSHRISSFAVAVVLQRHREPTAGGRQLRGVAELHAVRHRDVARLLHCGGL